MRLPPAWRQSLKVELRSIESYAKLVGGALGRLVISLAYFVSVANTLSVADFGLFATASASGIVLSRVAGFGFVSPLYRAATGKSRLIGVYTASLIGAFLASLPLVLALSVGFYLLFFDGEMSVLAFAAVLTAEIVFWRALEIVCIVNNGLNRFGRGAITVIMGTTIRALAALLFAAVSNGSLLTWSLAYLGANALAAILAASLFYPRQRLRMRLGIYRARWKDAASVATAEVAFYLQSELDKLLVLALGGPQTAGIYAILMRLVDLTALPVRSANTLIVQKVMKTPGWLSSWRMRWGIEAVIAAVSIAGLGAMGLLLHVYPRALGDNVADAAPLILLALLVPAFRNLVEYESELLYASGKTGVRVLILVLLGGMKAGLLAMLLTTGVGGTGWIVGLNGVFATLWLVSVTTSYTAFDWDKRRGASAINRAVPRTG